MRKAPEIVVDEKENVLWNIQVGQQNTGLGRQSLIRLATEAEAICRIGGRVMINPRKLKSYVDSNSGR